MEVGHAIWVAGATSYKSEFPFTHPTPCFGRPLSSLCLSARVLVLPFFERSNKELASIYLAEENFTGGYQETVYTRERTEPQKISEKRKGKYYLSEADRKQIVDLPDTVDCI
jgi:hypothetical protein